jgi:hypothetical protein
MEEIVPHDWKYGIICLIQKKEDVMMCDTYRAATLLCTMFTILANILYVKLLSFAEERIEYRVVFRMVRSSLDKMFTMIQILEKCWEQNTDALHLFIDFQAAHDTME